MQAHRRKHAAKRFHLGPLCGDTGFKYGLLCLLTLGIRPAKLGHQYDMLWQLLGESTLSKIASPPDANPSSIQLCLLCMQAIEIIQFCGYVFLFADLVEFVLHAISVKQYAAAVMVVP
jgi:hypothetical protein